MDRQRIITRLRAHEAELRRAGVLSLSLFGSAARDDAGPASDVDLAVRLSDDFATAASNMSVAWTRSASASGRSSATRSTW